MSQTSAIDRLIVTNGDCAVEVIRTALDGASLGGWDLLPWRDVLHDGPVPAHLDDPALAAERARFIATRGWAGEEATVASFHERDARFAEGINGNALVLWFEHDLYDQLHLLQLLDRLSRSPGRVRPALIVHNAFVAQQDSATLVEHFASRQPVTPAQLALGRDGWRAFRAPTPHEWVALVLADNDTVQPLPYLRNAMLRLLDEYPNPRDGLSCTQRRTLEAVAAGTRSVGTLFGAVTVTEEAAFMGDLSYYQVVAGLVDAATPALAMAGGGAFRHPSPKLDPETFRKQVMRLTAFGRALLDGRADWVQSNGIDRWVGGVHLTTHAAWRWDCESRRLI